MPRKRKSEPPRYGGAWTNQRILDLRKLFELTRSDLPRMTTYSKTHCEAWLLPTTSANWREAPEAAVRLLEYELGLRKPPRRKKA